jgi:hypothetical protein
MLHRQIICTTIFLVALSGQSKFARSAQPGENDELQAAILKDFFDAIPVSPKCMEGGAAATTNVELSYAAPVPSHFDERSLKHEKDLFLLSMSDPSPQNKNQSWTFRAGRGGNIYSFIGAYGEAIPPQKHDNAPWMDEVWQSVTVDVSLKTSFTYDIHQAGECHIFVWLVFIHVRSYTHNPTQFTLVPLFEYSITCLSLPM